MKLKVGDQVWYENGVHIITGLSKLYQTWAQLDGKDIPVPITELKKYTPKIGRVRG